MVARPPDSATPRDRWLEGCTRRFRFVPLHLFASFSAKLPLRQQDRGAGGPWPRTNLFRLLRHRYPDPRGLDRGAFRLRSARRPAAGSRAPGRKSNSMGRGTPRSGDRFRQVRASISKAPLDTTWLDEYWRRYLLISTAGYFLLPRPGRVRAPLTGLRRSRSAMTGPRNWLPVGFDPLGSTRSRCLLVIHGPRRRARMRCPTAGSEWLAQLSRIAVLPLAYAREDQGVIECWKRSGPQTRSRRFSDP